MICRNVAAGDGRRSGPKRIPKNVLLAFFLILLCGSFLLAWIPESTASDAQQEVAEAQDNGGAQAGETQGEAAEAAAPAEEEKGTLDSIKGVFSSWGHKAGVQKDKLSIKYDLRKLRGKIEDDYQELGRVFFKLYKDGSPDITNAPELKEILGALVEKHAELENLEARLAELGAEGDEDSEKKAGEQTQEMSPPAEEKPAD